MVASDRAVPALIGVFLVLIGLAWVVADPPGYGPDERAHYVKALGVGGGQLYGEPETVSREDLEGFFQLFRGPSGQSGLEELRRQTDSPSARWQRSTSRQFALPAGLDFSAFGCGKWTNEGWGSCLAQGRSSTKPTETGTYVGTYQPYLYALPGLLMRTTHELLRALRLGRSRTP